MSDIKKPEIKKAAPKKANATKPKEKKLPVLELWSISNDIESIANRMSGVKSIIEMCAENTSDELRSGSLWTAADYLDRLLNDLDKQNSRIMEAYKKYLAAGGDQAKIVFANSGWGWED